MDSSQDDAPLNQKSRSSVTPDSDSPPNQVESSSATRSSPISLASTTKTSWWQRLQPLRLTKRRRLVLVVACSLGLLVSLYLVPTTRYSLLGLVIKKSVTLQTVDQATSLPVANVFAVLNHQTAFSDGHGQVQFKRIPVGDYRVLVTRDSYQTINQSLRVPIWPLFPPTPVHVTMALLPRPSHTNTNGNNDHKQDGHQGGDNTISVSSWLTTGDRSSLLQQQGNLSFTTDSGSNPLTITVDETKKYQQVEGIGEALTDSAAWLLYDKMNLQQRTDFLTKMFDPNTGIGLNYLRLTIGASDYSLGVYSYDDNKPSGRPDPSLSHFSISHDQAYIIPVLKQILHINPHVKILASPWSPPAWMKTNDSMIGNIGGTLKQEYYQTYANYFVKYIQAYQQAGITIDAVTVQNEPGNEVSWPGMPFTSTQEADFVANYLGPTFKRNGITTKIIVYDFNWNDPSYPEGVYKNSTAYQYITGSGYHCYAGDPSAMTMVHNAYPDKAIYATECAYIGPQHSDFGVNLNNDVGLIVQNFRNWSTTSMMWNLVIDTEGGPRNGNGSHIDPPGYVDEATGDVTISVEYYAFGQASKSVAVGAYRIASTDFGTSSIQDVAFLNPDGSKTLIVLNSSPLTQTFKILWGAKSFTYTLLINSAVTFKWR